jgi:cell division protein FtsL
MSGLSRQRVRRLAAGITVAMLFAAGLLWQRMQVVKMGYEVVELSARRDRLMMENSALRRDLRKLYTLSHAESVARSSLGMDNLDTRQVVYLPDPSQTGPGLVQRVAGFFRSWWQ